MKIRQGDILLIKIKALPKEIEKLTDKVLAYGEATGHSHRFNNPSLVDRYTADGKLYLQVYQPATIIHEEHHEQVILPGVYEQIQEREYDYVEESMRQVVD